MRTDHIDRFNEATSHYLKICDETLDQIKQELDRVEVMKRMAIHAASKEVQVRDAVRPSNEEPIPAFLGQKEVAA